MFYAGNPEFFKSRFLIHRTYGAAFSKPNIFLPIKCSYRTNEHVKMVWLLTFFIVSEEIDSVKSELISLSSSINSSHRLVLNTSTIWHGRFAAQCCKAQRLVLGPYTFNYSAEEDSFTTVSASCVKAASVAFSLSSVRCISSIILMWPIFSANVFKPP